MLKKPGESVFDTEFNEDALLDMYASDDTDKINKFNDAAEKVKVDCKRAESAFNKHITQFNHLDREARQLITVSGRPSQASVKVPVLK
jgi:hypothetical protein